MFLFLITNIFFILQLTYQYTVTRPTALASLLVRKYYQKCTFTITSFLHQYGRYQLKHNVLYSSILTNVTLLMNFMQWPNKYIIII